MSAVESGDNFIQAKFIWSPKSNIVATEGFTSCTDVTPSVLRPKKSEKSESEKSLPHTSRRKRRNLKEKHS